MLPLRPHLYWGGSSCPGKRWPEWVPQLRIAAEEDDVTEDQLRRIIQDELKPVRADIATVKEQVGDTYNQVNPKAGAVLIGLRKTIRAIPSGGGGSTPDEMRDAVLEALREGTG